MEQGVDYHSDGGDDVDGGHDGDGGDDGDGGNDGDGGDGDLRNADHR